VQWRTEQFFADLAPGLEIPAGDASPRDLLRRYLAFTHDVQIRHEEFMRLLLAAIDRP
jgi:hypothetical protein